MIRIDLICESCGTSNPAGTEFCTNCNSYLAWDRSAKPAPSTVPTKPVTPAPTPTPYAEVDYPTQPQPVTAPFPDPAYAQQGQTTYANAPGQDPGGYDTAYDQQAAYEAAQGQQTYPDFSCPYCGQVNVGTRRYCSKCGYSFYANEPVDPNAGTWSSATLAAYDRQARLAYRRSLPPLYRWRRVIIVVLCVALATAATIALHADPVGVVKNGWYWLSKTYVSVEGVQVAVEPADAVQPPSTPADLVDGSERELTLKWTPSQTSSTCDPAAGTGTIVIRFPQTRIRQLYIVSGLADPAQRPLQPLPKTLGVRFDNGTCVRVPLDKTAQQTVQLDSQGLVSEMRIGIADAYPAGQDAQPLISIAEVILRSYPS